MLSQPQVVFSQGEPWSPPLLPGGGEIDWWVQIAAMGNGVDDYHNYAGVADDAQQGVEPWDRYDVFELEMLPPGDYISLYFRYTKPYSQVIQPPADELSWPIRVTANFDGEVTLIWDVSHVPASYRQVLLEDLLGNTTIDMLTTPEFSYTCQSEQPRRFSLFISTATTPPEEEEPPVEEEPLPEEEFTPFPEEAPPPEEEVTPPTEEEVAPEEEITPLPPEEEVAPPSEEVIAPPPEEEAPAPQQPPEEEMPQGVNWPLIGGVIGAVVVIGGLITYLVRRRA